NFSVDEGENEGFIRLAQTTDTHFKLESRITYGGATGLEDRKPPLSDASWKLLRNLEPADLENTDLASIPAPMRWWVNTYGRHTAAALIHDRFIGIPEGLPQPLKDDGLGEEHIDRYFRFMLADSGIEFIPRWIMWSAVALRTRFMRGGGRRLMLIAWFLAALGGFVGLLWALRAGEPAWIAVFSFAPWPAAALWGRQWGAGMVASYVVFPFLLIPIALAILFLLPFYGVQRLFGRWLERMARRAFKGLEPSYYTDAPISVGERRDPPDISGVSHSARAD
ncbi:MAG: DUF1353 domain-containing protein, partial [Acidimicrobiales bacterium]|nr:DUF1353 domain-containing protein [Acidimicrobiales bacterium]